MRIVRRRHDDKPAFAVPQQNQRPEARVGLELLAPGNRVGDVGLQAQVALIRGGRQARRHTALVVAHAGDVVPGQHPGQALEAVIACAVGAVAVAVGGAGAGDDQHHGHWFVGLGQQQRTEKFAAAGVQSDRAL